MSRTALFVIDIQRALADDPNTEVPHAARVCNAAATLLSQCRKTPTSPSPPDAASRPINIVIVQHEDAEHEVLVRGSRAWELLFPPAVDEHLVTKTTRNTFETNPHLAAELQAQGVHTIAVCGLQSNFCVLATCKGALEAGFRVVLLRGAHSTYDVGDRTAEEIERQVEREVEACGGEIIEWERWVELI